MERTAKGYLQNQKEYEIIDKLSIVGHVLRDVSFFAGEMIGYDVGVIDLFQSMCYI